MKKNRKWLWGICLLSMSLLLGACGKEPNPEEEIVDEENVLSIPTIQGIGELATLQCSFRNVAVINKEKGTGFEHIGEKDRKMWIEYTGIVEVSYETDQIRYVQDGVNIKITLPEPKITCYEDWVDEKSAVSSQDNWLQKNPITEENIRLAILEGNSKMRQEFINDSSLLRMARNQAETLITNHIKEIGAAAGIEYNIIFTD